MKLAIHELRALYAYGPEAKPPTLSLRFTIALRGRRSRFGFR